MNDMKPKRELTYATVCSGIECMSVACIGLPMRPVFFSEIEPFPCAVLKAHYPDVPNLGDMSKIQINNQTEITNGTVRLVLERPLDILAGGTPCQDVSVAGKRAGMQEGSGTRSSLAFDFVRLARELRPRWVLWENVAGSIDSKNAPDFLRFASALGDCGYSLAWRVLDAQYVRVDGMERAVPQRRRRVWVVGCLGADESVPAQILFEPDCVAGRTTPRRRAGQGFAYTIAGRDSVDAGLVGEPARCDVLNFQGSKGNNCVTDDVSCPNLNAMHGHDVHVVAQEGGGCLNPLDPQSKRLFTPDGPFHTVDAMNGGGGRLDGVCIDCANWQGVAYCANGVSFDGRKDAPIADGVAHSQTIGTNPGFKDGVVQCYENHAQDSRVKRIEVSDTRNQKDGTGGNNLPLVVSTNSNGEDVAATLAANISKLGGDNQTTFGGGYVLTRRQEGAEGE